MDEKNSAIEKSLQNILKQLQQQSNRITKLEKLISQTSTANGQMSIYQQDEKQQGSSFDWHWFKLTLEKYRVEIISLIGGILAFVGIEFLLKRSPQFREPVSIIFNLIVMNSLFRIAKTNKMPLLRYLGFIIAAIILFKLWFVILAPGYTLYNILFASIILLLLGASVAYQQLSKRIKQ